MRGDLALARHVRDRVFRLEDFCRLLHARRDVSLNAFMYCVHRLNHYGVLSFGCGGEREDRRYLELVRALWPRMRLAQRFETVISLAKLHQRQPSPPVFAFVSEFLRTVQLEDCRNYTFNQLMHIAIIMNSREVFQACLALAARAPPQDLLMVSRLALGKNLSKFAAMDQPAETEAAFQRYVAPLELAGLAPSDLLSLYFSTGLLLRKFPQSALFARFLDRLDHRLAVLPVSAEAVYRGGLGKVIAGSKLRPALFLDKWLQAVLRAPGSFSRHVALAEAAEQLGPGQLTPELLAYYVYEHAFPRDGGAALARLRALVFTRENAYLLETLPDTPFAFLAERLRLLDEQSYTRDQM